MREGFQIILSVLSLFCVYTKPNTASANARFLSLPHLSLYRGLHSSAMLIIIILIILLANLLVIMIIKNILLIALIILKELSNPPVGKVLVVACGTKHSTCNSTMLRRLIINFTINTTFIKSTKINFIYINNIR